MLVKYAAISMLISYLATMTFDQVSLIYVIGLIQKLAIYFVVLFVISRFLKLVTFLANTDYGAVERSSMY